MLRIEEPESMQALEKAVASGTPWPRAWADLLRSVAQAAELEPWNPAVFVTRALVLGAVGRCDEAVASGQQALDLLPDNPTPSQVRVLADERDRIGRACRALPDP